MTILNCVSFSEILYYKVNIILCFIYVNILLSGSSDECVSVVNKMKNSRFNIHEQENSANVQNVEVTLIPNCNCMLKG